MDINSKDYQWFIGYVTEQWPIKERIVAGGWREILKEKEIAKLETANHKEYVKELGKRDEVLEVAARFEDYPEEVRHLFLYTARMMVDCELAKKVYADKMEAKFVDKYGKDIANRLHVPYYMNTREMASWMTRKQILEKLRPFTKEGGRLHHLTEDEIVQCFNDIISVRLARETAKKALTPSDTIALWGRKLSSIDTMIRNRMGGVPDGFEREADWGVGGYYNGILVKDGTRVSFKSFVAGGYNIQRAHIRVRLTTLKKKAA